MSATSVSHASPSAAMAETSALQSRPHRNGPSQAHQGALRRWLTIAAPCGLLVSFGGIFSGVFANELGLSLLSATSAAGCGLICLMASSSHR